MFALVHSHQNADDEDANASAVVEAAAFNSSDKKSLFALVRLSANLQLRVHHVVDWLDTCFAVVSVSTPVSKDDAKAIGIVAVIWEITMLVLLLPLRRVGIRRSNSLSFYLITEPEVAPCHESSSTSCRRTKRGFWCCWEYGVEKIGFSFLVHRQLRRDNHFRSKC